MELAHFETFFESGWGSLVVGTGRWLGMTFFIPFLRDPIMPHIPRMCFIFLMSLVTFPIVHEQWIIQEWTTGLGMTMIVLKEFVIGAFLGIPIGLLFSICKSIGDFIDNQRGASIATVFNPSAGEQSSIYGILLEQAFIAFFLATVGFSGLFTFMVSSYDVFPIGLPSLSIVDVPYITVLLKYLYIYLDALVILSAPAVASMLLVEIGLGLVGRFVPQLNVFFISMPVKSLVALIILIVTFTTIMSKNDDITLPNIIQNYTLEFSKDK